MLNKLLLLDLATFVQQLQAKAFGTEADLICSYYIEQGSPDRTICARYANMSANTPTVNCRKYL